MASRASEPRCPCTAYEVNRSVLAECSHWSLPVTRRPLSSQWPTGSALLNWVFTWALAGLTASAISWVAATRVPRQETVIIDADDPAADPAEVELLRHDGNRVLAMLPLVAKGQSIGLVELFSKTPIEFDAERLGLARTMANEAAMALENARLYEEARNPSA